MTPDERFDRLERKVDFLIEAIRELGKAIAIADKLDLLMVSVQGSKPPDAAE